MNIKGRLLLTIFLAAAGTVAAVACGSSDGEPSVREASAAPAETQSLAVVLPPEPDLGTGVVGGHPDFDVTSWEWPVSWCTRVDRGGRGRQGKGDAERRSVGAGSGQKHHAGAGAVDGSDRQAGAADKQDEPQQAHYGPAAKLVIQEFSTVPTQHDDYSVAPLTHGQHI